MRLLYVQSERLDVMILSAADTLLSACAVQTGEDPNLAVDRAIRALAEVAALTEAEQRAAAELLEQESGT